MQDTEFLRVISTYTNLSACPIATTFKILGKRWTIEIVRELSRGQTRFNELMKNVPGINSRMLSLRLEELENHGLIARTVLIGRPVRIKYTLTKLGMDVIPVMFAAAEFSMKNFPEEVFEDGKSRTPLQIAREIRQTKAKSILTSDDDRQPSDRGGHSWT